MVNSEGKGPADVEDALRDLNDLKGQTQNPCTGTRIDDLLCLDTPATITAGTEPFGFGPNKKMYINHYEVIITAGMAAKGEGLLYLPLVKASIPVEWSGLKVNRSQTGDYGCVLAPGQVQMQGSQSGVISGDLYRQVMALLTQGPGSFSGKFGEAVKLISQQGDSLQRGQTINWALAKGALEASKDGFEKWRTETQNYFTKEGGSVPQEVQTIISQMQATQDKLYALSTCVVQNIPPSSSKKSIFPTHTFFACELTAADIAKMKGLEEEMEEMSKNLFIFTKLPEILTFLDENKFDSNPPIDDCVQTNRTGNINFNGTAEHWLIQWDYIETHPGGMREFKIPQSSGSGRTGYCDLANVLRGELFEIKPLSQALIGASEIQVYEDMAKLHCPRIPIWHKGTNYSTRILPHPRNPTMELKVTLQSEGLIIYQSQNRTTPEPVPVLIPENLLVKLKDLLKRTANNIPMMERELAIYLQQNPNAKLAIKAAGYTAITAFVVYIIANDVTLVGILDDVAGIRVAWSMAMIINKL